MKAINFVPSGDTHKQCLMHSKSDKIEIMINDKTDKVIEELFNHFVLVIILGWKHQQKVVVLYLIVFIRYIIVKSK